MLVPDPWCGEAKLVPFENIEWIKDLPDNTYCALWQRWPSQSQVIIPSGYDLYVFSFHLEAVDVDWVNQQSLRLQSPIILLSDSNYYDYPFNKNVWAYTYYYWHEQTRLISSWYPNRIAKSNKFKASAFCNRITQSKLWIFTALAEHVKNDCLLKLDDWLEEKNVHYREKTNIKELDKLSDVFWSKYWGKTFSIDSFNNEKHNYQQYTCNPYSRAYIDALFNFTNESFHYSYHCNETCEFVYPGPFLTEKTLKCLAGGTPFVAVGQYDTYNPLSILGFDFDYGPLDLSWDNDPGNLSRMLSVIELIKQLSSYSINDLVDFTKSSAEHNYNHVIEKGFYNMCQLHNNKIIEQIFSDIN